MRTAGTHRRTRKETGEEDEEEGWTQAMALALALLPRLGAESPAALLDPHTVGEIARLLVPPAVVVTQFSLSFTHPSIKNPLVLRAGQWRLLVDFSSSSAFVPATVTLWHRSGSAALKVDLAGVVSRMHVFGFEGVFAPTPTWIRVPSEIQGGGKLRRRPEGLFPPPVGDEASGAAAVEAGEGSCIGAGIFVTRRKVLIRHSRTMVVSVDLGSDDVEAVPADSTSFGRPLLEAAFRADDPNAAIHILSAFADKRAAHFASAEVMLFARVMARYRRDVAVQMHCCQIAVQTVGNYRLGDSTDAMVYAALAAIEAHMSSLDVVLGALRLLVALTTQHNFPSILLEHGGIRAVLSALYQHRDQVADPALNVLKVLSRGATPSIVDALSDAHSVHCIVSQLLSCAPSAQSQGLELLARCSETPKFRDILSADPSGFAAVLHSMKACKKEAYLQDHGLNVLARLTLDGTARRNEPGLVEAVLRVLGRHAHRFDLAKKAATLLAALLKDGVDVAETARNEGGVEAVLIALQAQETSSSMCVAAFDCLAVLSPEDNKEAAERIVSAILCHPRAPEVLEAGFRALAALAVDEENAAFIAALGGIELLLDGLQNFVGVTALEIEACNALYALVRAGEEICDLVDEDRAVTLLTDLVETNPHVLHCAQQILAKIKANHM